MATQAAQAPFQMPAAPVAGFTPFQQQYFNAIQGMQGMAQPYFNTGQGYLQQSAAPVTGQDVAGYYNPMAQNVFANLQDIFGQQMMETTGSATQTAGGVGADRIGVAQSQLAKQQGLAAGQTAAGLYQQALQAAEQQKQMEAGAGYGIAQMGPAAQAAQLQGIGALGTAGGQQQQLTQQQLNAQYQQQLARLAYPFQTAQYLAGITGGLGPSMGYQQYGTGATTLPSPTPLAQVAGVGLGGVGLLGATGAFGPSGYLTGTGKGGGVSSPTNLAFDTSGLGTGSSYYYGNRGGRIHPFQTGGAAEQDSGIPGIPVSDEEYLTPIPHIKTSGPNAPKQMDLTPKVQQSTTTGGGKGSGVGTALNIGMKLLPLAFAAQGGAVSPFDVGQPFQGGGTTEEIDATDLPPLDEESLGLGKPVDWGSRENAPAEIAAGANPHTLGETGDTSYAPGFTPAAYRPPQSPMGVMPQGQVPYPDALKRDIGQQAARSPWMALVAAGAQMAQTRGPIGSVIGAGMGAGAKELEGQRKALQSEEDINIKAQHLQQMAQQHLDSIAETKRYHDILDQERQDRLQQQRYQWQPGTGTDPNTGAAVSGAWRMPTKPGEKPEFMPGMNITGRGSVKDTALLRNINGLVEMGIASDKNAAYHMLNRSTKDPAMFSSLVLREKTFLANQPGRAGRTPEQLQQEAESNVRTAQERAQLYLSGQQPPAATHAGTRDDPIPHVEGMKPQSGKYYLINGQLVGPAP